MEGKGVFKTRGVGGLPDTARVVDHSVAFDCPERQYRSRGYKPPFDELAWLPDTGPAASAPKSAAGRGVGTAKTARDQRPPITQE